MKLPPKPEIKGEFWHPYPALSLAMKDPVKKRAIYSALYRLIPELLDLRTRAGKHYLMLGTKRAGERKAYVRKRMMEKYVNPACRREGVELKPQQKAELATAAFNMVDVELYYTMGTLLQKSKTHLDPKLTKASWAAYTQMQSPSVHKKFNSLMTDRAREEYVLQHLKAENNKPFIEYPNGTISKEVKLPLNAEEMKAVARATVRMLKAEYN